MEQTLINGRYAPHDLLGVGGMAKVYLAHDELLSRDVALKVLREQYAEDEKFVERFEREARSVAALSHPNIVQIHDRGRSEDGRYYIVMEHVPGGTLKEYMKAEGPLGCVKAAGLAAQVAGALGTAHEGGVVHRDVKPQNVLLAGGDQAKVADFGIARAASAASISRSSLILGTPGYMSPEQATGESATPRSDLYSLGVVLYEMLTGRVPFEAETPVAVSMKHVNEPPRPPKELNPEIPESMNALVLKLLSKDPKDRHASAAELIEDLRRVSDGAPPVVAGVAGAAAVPTQGGAPTLPLSARAAAPGRSRRAPVTLASLAVLLALLVTGGWYVLQGSGGPGIAGALKGVPEEARQALEDARRTVSSIGAADVAEVPDVMGLSEEAAKERLADAGFKSEPRPRKSSEIDAGKVLEQSVAGGKGAEEGSIILLAIGAGPQEVPAPELSSLRLEEAEKELSEAGLQLGDVNEVPSDVVPEGEIVEQDPRAGTDVDPGTSVDLVVSSGLAPPQIGEDGAGGGEEPSGEAEIRAPSVGPAPVPEPAVEQPAPAPEQPVYEEPVAPLPEPVPPAPVPAEEEPAPVQQYEAAPPPAEPDPEEQRRYDGREGDYSRDGYDGTRDNSNRVQY